MRSKQSIAALLAAKDKNLFKLPTPVAPFPEISPPNKLPSSPLIEQNLPVAPKFGKIKRILKGIKHGF